MENENDVKVVTFKNIASFDFTPALGAMFNSRPIFGKVEAGKIVVGEELFFPYHIGRRLAINLAKAILVKELPLPDHGKGDPSVTPKGFGDEQIKDLVVRILVSEYKEEKPIKESETDVLLRKFEELNKTVEDLKGSKITSEGFKDKKQVIEELTKKGITFDARKSKAELEKLLA
jgi:hypothetical protein